MSEPTVLYEWTFPPDRGCRIIEIEPGIVIGQERESHDAPWRDEPCPSGWKHELIALAQETSDWRSDAAMAVLETCGDEEHCTCVGPLRKLARDLGMDKAALVLTLEVETDLRRKAENDLAHEKARHAHEIEKARGLLASLVKHLELSVGEGAKLSTTHRLASAALAALEVGK